MHGVPRFGQGRLIQVRTPSTAVLSKIRTTPNQSQILNESHHCPCNAWWDDRVLPEAHRGYNTLVVSVWVRVGARVRGGVRDWSRKRGSWILNYDAVQRTIFRVPRMTAHIHALGRERCGRSSGHWHQSTALSLPHSPPSPIPPPRSISACTSGVVTTWVPHPP